MCRGIRIWEFGSCFDKPIAINKENCFHTVQVLAGTEAGNESFNQIHQLVDSNRRWLCWWPKLMQAFKSIREVRKHRWRNTKHLGSPFYDIFSQLFPRANGAIKKTRWKIIDAHTYPWTDKYYWALWAHNWRIKNLTKHFFVFFSLFSPAFVLQYPTPPVE